MTKKTAKKKKNKGASSGGGAKEFLVFHAEKIVGGVIAVVALWFIIQGLSYLGPQVNWHPNELVEGAAAVRTSINASTRAAVDEGIEFRDHAATAEQIRDPISATPYRFVAPWHFAPASQRSTSGGSSSTSSSSSY